MNPGSSNLPKTVIGWREWVGLPRLGVAAIKAKIDTGARTSAIHAFHIEAFERNGTKMVSFGIHPVQHHREPEIQCEAEVLEERVITSSSGAREKRYVILTDLVLGKAVWPTELTLANRDQLGFRLLVGRQAIRNHYLIDPGRSYLLGRPRRGTSVARRSQGDDT